MYSILGGSPNTMVPKYTEYFLIQRIAKLNRQQTTPLTETRVVFIAGDTLRHQPMGSWSHDCSSSAGLLDSYPALVLYLAGVALHQQPMGSRSHDCSSYVGCGEFRVLYWCRPMPACISGNKRWHPDGYLIWCPRTGFSLPVLQSKHHMCMVLINENDLHLQLVTMDQFNYWHT